MTKYTTAIPAPAPAPGVTKTDAAFSPTREALVYVPREQAVNMAAPWALGFVVLGVIGVPLAGYAGEWRAWLAVVGVGVLLFLWGYARYYPRQQAIVTEAMFKQEVAEGRDLDGDGVVGHPLVPNNSRRNTPPAGETERAVMLRFVGALYDKGTSYNALRPLGLSDTQIRDRLTQLAQPEWGILRMVRHGRRESPELVLSKTDALRVVESAVALDD